MKRADCAVKLLAQVILLWSVYSTCVAYENPFLTAGHDQPDGVIGKFSQSNTGDCFFLASLIAIANDLNGQTLIESSFHQDKSKHLWKIFFTGLNDQVIEVKEQELGSYRLMNSEGKGLSEPVLGDSDIKILQIAADKLWKRNIKPEGLWDDVPMNVVYMFSNTEQLLIWNKGKASQKMIEDIDKYKRIPAGVIKEINLASKQQAIDLLKTILVRDTDGISMILIDYINYHAVAVNEINFNQNSYSYIDTSLISHHDQNLDTLLSRLLNGQYAINYVEIK